MNQGQLITEQQSRGKKMAEGEDSKRTMKEGGGIYIYIHRLREIDRYIYIYIWIELLREG